MRQTEHSPSGTIRSSRVLCCRQLHDGVSRGTLLKCAAAAAVQEISLPSSKRCGQSSRFLSWSSVLTKHCIRSGLSTSTGDHSPRLRCHAAAGLQALTEEQNQCTGFSERRREKEGGEKERVRGLPPSHNPCTRSCRRYPGGTLFDEHEIFAELPNKLKVSLLTLLPLHSCPTLHVCITRWPSLLALLAVSGSSRLSP